MQLFKGAAVALVTPYTANGIDYDAMRNLIERQLNHNIDAIVVAGTTGEAATMTEREHLDVMAFVVKTVNKRCPVIAGTGSNCTEKAIALSKQAEKIGADGLLVVTPYYNKGTQNSIVAHYKAIAEAVHTPIIAYNVPSRTGLNILPTTVKALSSIKGIVGIKEASGDISQVAEILRICPPDFAVYSGNDDAIVPILSLGGQGVISVVANLLPTETRTIVSHFFSGDVKAASALQLKINGLVNALFIETNPIPVKYALNLLGECSGHLRLPLTPLTEENASILKREMANLGLIGGIHHESH